ncbi:hypothetical protein HPB50_021704 [Hyalomma asiaticum]|uniref:Uncharacterized protein n=1 Tax=Hyalomma asiaticum TaxID=266040 RepID=A0ACB7T7F6_HYAAI|nr:hypothetical protein HPB50_021704 [Hyalomma asiaticum]
MALLPQRSSSSRRELANVMAPPMPAASYSRSKHGPLGGAYYSGYPGGGAAVAAVTAAAPYGVGGPAVIGHGEAPAMPGKSGTFPYVPHKAPSKLSADPRWIHTEPVKPNERPILSPHGYYMCIAVSIVVAIGVVVAFGFFIIQRRFAQAVVNK